MPMYTPEEIVARFDNLERRIDMMERSLSDLAAQQADRIDALQRDLKSQKKMTALPTFDELPSDKRA